MRVKHPKNIFLGDLNVSSLRKKFESVNELIKDTFDIPLVNKSKLDSNFPDNQLPISGYHIIREDRNKNGAGKLFYNSKDIPFKVIESNTFTGNLEILKLEIVLDNMQISIFKAILSCLRRLLQN